MMSDCPKCWNTPCTCGYEYRDWTVQKLNEQIGMLHQAVEHAREKAREIPLETIEAQKFSDFLSKLYPPYDDEILRDIIRIPRSVNTSD